MIFFSIKQYFHVAHREQIIKANDWFQEGKSEGTQWNIVTTARTEGNWRQHPPQEKPAVPFLVLLIMSWHLHLLSIHSSLLRSCPTSCEPAWSSSIVAKRSSRQYRDNSKIQKLNLVEPCLWFQSYKWSLTFNILVMDLGKHPKCITFLLISKTWEKERNQVRKTGKVPRSTTTGVNFMSFTVVGGKREQLFHGQKLSSSFTMRKISELRRTSETLTVPPSQAIFSKVPFCTRSLSCYSCTSLEKYFFFPLPWIEPLK